MNEPKSFESLTSDHDFMWVSGLAAFVVLAFLIVSTLLLTRDQIQGLPQVAPVIVQELRCAYGDHIETAFADDGSPIGVCKR